MNALITAVLLAAAPSPLPSFHGLHLAVEGSAPFLVVTVSWEDDDEPATGIAISVFAPEGEEAFQTGTSDPSGRFTFQPTIVGAWRVVADDGTGHRATEVVDVGPAYLSGTEPIDTHGEHGEELPLWVRVGWGLCLIAAVAGLAYGVSARRAGDRKV